jgi:GT2 family glycosyltransferase
VKERGDLPESPRVTVAIRSRERPDGLCATVGDVWAGTRLPDELVVVCQGAGAEEAVRLLRREVPGVVPVLRFYASSRAGASRNWNDALRLATGDFIAFADDDMRVPQDWLASMLEVWNEDWAGEPVLLTGPILAPADSADPNVVPGQRKGAAKRVWREPTAEDVLFGGHFGAPRIAYELAGSPPFDERFGPGTRFPGAGDIAFALRLLRAGVPVVFDPSIRVTHMARAEEWVGDLFRHSQGNGALFVHRLLSGEPRVLRMAANTLAGNLAKGLRAAARGRFRESAGRFALILGIMYGAGRWIVTRAGKTPSAVSPRPGDLRQIGP